MNEKFFQKWSPSMAYILGFTMADGNVLAKGIGNYSGDGHVLRYCIHLKDKCVLEYIRHQLQSSNKIYERKYTGSDGIYREQCELVINNKNMIYDLINLGVIPAKTGFEKIPENIPTKFIPDFIRGFFDGDGSICISTQLCKSNNKIYRYHNLKFISASKIILEQIKQYFDIDNKIIHTKKEHCYRYQIASYKNIKTIYSIMYYNGFDFCLKRKYDKFVEGGYVDG